MLRLVADVVTGQVDVRAVAATLPDAPEPVADLVADSDDDPADTLAEVDGQGAWALALRRTLPVRVHIRV